MLKEKNKDAEVVPWAGGASPEQARLQARVISTYVQMIGLMWEPQYRTSSQAPRPSWDVRRPLGKLFLKGKPIHPKESSSRERHGLPEQFYHLVSVKQSLPECSCTGLTCCCKCFGAANDWAHSRGQITITKFAAIITKINFKTPCFCYLNSP